MNIPQQSVNLLRQCLNMPGWAKTVSDFFIAGKLLSDSIPVIDLSWVKTNEQIALLTPIERDLYVLKDKEFGNKMIELPTFNDKERETIRRCLTEVFSKVPPDRFSYLLYSNFGFSSE